MFNIKLVSIMRKHFYGHLELSRQVFAHKSILCCVLLLFFSATNLIWLLYIGF